MIKMCRYVTGHQQMRVLRAPSRLGGHCYNIANVDSAAGLSERGKEAPYHDISK